MLSANGTAGGTRSNSLAEGRTSQLDIWKLGSKHHTFCGLDCEYVIKLESEYTSESKMDYLKWLKPKVLLWPSQSPKHHQKSMHSPGKSSVCRHLNELVAICMQTRQTYPKQEVKGSR